MPKKPPKKTEDVNEAAFRVVAQSTGEPSPPPTRKKNPAAVALGRRGGLKGGKARADALTPEQRQQIARAAAQKRWEKKG